MKKNVVLLILCVFFPGRAFAEICTAPVANAGWGLAYSAVYATQTAAAAACSAKLPTLSGISHSDCAYAGSPYFYYYIDDYTNHSHYKFGHCACEYYDPVTSECSDCSAKRAELEETCGEPGYILDEETCEGECAGCPDSDDDGVEDACDFCPSVKDYGRKKIKKYTVPKHTICGTYLYEGDNCGYSEIKCNGDEEFHPVSPQLIDASEMYGCCRAVIEEEQCIVDKNCDATRGDDVCKCPDGSVDCDLCKDGGCICSDTDGDGQPNNPCDSCQVDGCVCSDTDGDGQPNTPCLECQEEDSQSTDTDGDGMPDNKDPCPSNPDPNCGPGGDDTDGDGKKDNEDPCPNNPNPNCEPGDDDGDDIPDDKDPCPGNPDPDCTTTCLTTLDKFKAWTTTAESFPFNWMAAVKNMFGPLTSVNPSLPDSIGSMKVRLTVTEYGQSADLDFGSGYTVLRNSPVVTALAPAVALLRWAMGITIIFYMLPYFVARWHNIHGVSR